MPQSSPDGKAWQMFFVVVFPEGSMHAQPKPFDDAIPVSIRGMIAEGVGAADRFPHSAALCIFRRGSQIVPHREAKMSHVKREFFRSAISRVHDRNHDRKRLGVQRIAVLEHHVWIRDELACFCRSDKGQIGYKSIANGNLLQDRFGDRAMPMHALGVGVDAYPNADGWISGNVLRREIQRKADKVAIEPIVAGVNRKSMCRVA
jgi:hypothetical protein